MINNKYYKYHQLIRKINLNYKNNNNQIKNKIN